MPTAATPPPDDKDLKKLMPDDPPPRRNGASISRNQVALAIVTGFFGLCTAGLTIVSGNNAQSAANAKYVTQENAQIFKTEFLKVQQQQMQNVVRIAELERKIEELEHKAAR